MTRRKQKFKRNEANASVGGRNQGDLNTSVAIVHAADASPLYVWLCLAIVVVGGCLAFSNSFKGSFLYDDEKWTIKRAAARDKAPFKYCYDNERRALVALTLALNYRLNAKYDPELEEPKYDDIEPWGYHLVNLIIHLSAAVALFGLVRRTLMLKRFSEATARSAHWYALAVALLWVVHPLQTQSVTYVVQRAESLMGLCYILTLYCFVRGVPHAQPKRRWTWWGLAVFVCICGMYSKAVMVTAPLVVLAYDGIFIAKSPLELISKRWLIHTLLFLTLFALVERGVVQTTLDTKQKYSTVGFRLTNEEHQFHMTPLDYLRTQAGVIFHYIRLSFWPADQVIDHAETWPIAHNFTRQTCLTGAAILLLLAGVVWAALKKSWIAFAGIWFFIILAPTSSFIPIKDPVYEHRMYLPLAAIIALVIGAVAWAARKAMSNRPDAPRRMAFICVIFAVVAAAPLAFAAHNRNKAYYSQIAMWSDVVKKRPRNARAHNNLGKYLLGIAKANGDVKLVNQAIEHFKKAIEIDRKLTSPPYNLGNAYNTLKRYDEAIEAYKLSLEAAPGSLQSWIMLGNAYTNAGDLHEAEKSFRQALAISKQLQGHVNQFHVARAHFNLANTLIKLGRPDEALESYRKALESRPTHFKAAVGIGQACEALGRNDEAIAAYKRSLSINPGFELATARLAGAYERTGRIDAAIETYRQGLKHNPQSAGLILSLARLYSRHGMPNEAAQMMQRGAELYPNDRQFKPRAGNARR